MNHPEPAPGPAPAPPDKALDAFMAQVEARLGGIRPGRRRRLLVDLREHLREAVLEGEGPEGLLAGLDPADLAESLTRSESARVTQRALASLAATIAPALLCATFMVASHRGWIHAGAFGVGYGLSVGFALFWFRERWMGWGIWARAAAPALGALAAIPWAFMLSSRFEAPMLFYGAASGFLLERMARPMPWHAWILHNALLTGLAFLLAGLGSGWDPAAVSPRYLPWALGFHAVLQGGMALGLRAHRSVNRWFLERPL
ncbi:MAG TPA: hypothetical protein VK188_07510 [Holophaga sp.]|nr:hypothetical protein [Holophaga sp.]